MDVRLSVVIPTLGRSSLRHALASCSDADEIVVVLDTVRGGALPCELPANVLYAEGSFGVTGGHAGRVRGIELATGTHLAFFDDDDEYVPGAVQLMREAACDVPVIFRMDHPQHGVLWRERVLEFGNVSTQMYVVPNRPELLGSWMPHAPGLPEPGGDYTFIRETVDKMGGPVWREEIISVIRPSRSPSISIVTPWRDHPELADAYFEAVLPEMEDGDELVIVDTGSEPPLQFASTSPLAGLGFSGGSNFGLRLAKTDAVLFLNNDVEHVRRGWLAAIRDSLERGVLVGPLRYDSHGDVDGVTLPYIDGWCLAGMREDLLDLGGFDETLDEPAYFSDNLLSLEARARGMTLREARVGLRHIENVTAGPASDAAVRAATAVNRARFEARARELLTAA